jgi:hypothetical protein
MRAFLLLLFSAVCAVAGLPVRVGVIQLGDPGSPRLIAEEISRLDGIEVVRETLKLEEGRSPRSLTNGERRALGRQWRVQLLILVDPSGEAFAYVDADTGEELFRIREGTPANLARSAFLLVEELRDVVRAEERSAPK